MGAIMAVGVAVSNAIMLVSFGDRHRLEEGMPADRAVITAAKGRLRPIIMTGCAMIAGMIPMSLALEEGSEQNALWAGPSSAAWPWQPSPRCWSCRRSSRSLLGRSSEQVTARSTPTTRRARTMTLRSDPGPEAGPRGRARVPWHVQTEALEHNRRAARHADDSD